jgi:hypothetical protein
MSHAVLSEDESDHENGTHLGKRRYVIVKEAWRSDELIIWLRMTDLLGCGEKWTGRLVAQSGNERRLRVVSNRSTAGRAVSGLPENCYDPRWLKSLKKHERVCLDVKPATNMTFPDKLRSCAFICHDIVIAFLMLDPYREAARFIPLAKGEGQLSTNADIEPDTSGLDEWLLNEFGKVQD